MSGLEYTKAEIAFARELHAIGHAAARIVDRKNGVRVREEPYLLEELSEAQQAAWYAIARHVGSNTAGIIAAVAGGVT